MSRLNDILTPDILRKLAKVNILKFTVRGISMCPLIQPDDIVEIAASEKYEPSDILLYPYKEEGLLLHRLIKVDERLFCKGDNAFRLEDICQKEVIGKVVGLQRNGKKICIPAVNEQALALSFQISEDFRKGKYDKNIVVQQDAYLTFSAYLRKLNNDEDNKK